MRYDVVHQHNSVCQKQRKQYGISFKHFFKTS
jgi:hypothetical protein